MYYRTFNSYGVNCNVNRIENVDNQLNVNTSLSLLQKIKIKIELKSIKPTLASKE